MLPQDILVLPAETIPNFVLALLGYNKKRGFWEELRDPALLSFWENRIARQSQVWVSAGSCCALGDPCWILGALGWCWLLPNPPWCQHCRTSEPWLLGCILQRLSARKLYLGATGMQLPRNRRTSWDGTNHPCVAAAGLKQCGHPGWDYLWGGCSFLTPAVIPGPAEEMLLFC